MCGFGVIIFHEKCPLLGDNGLGKCSRVLFVSGIRVEIVLNSCYREIVIVHTEDLQWKSCISQYLN